VHFVSSSAGCQFSGFLAAPVSPVFVSCLGPHCSQNRFGFVFLPLSTVRDLSSSRSCFNLFGPHLDPSPPGPVSSLICSFVRGLCTAFLGAIFLLASRERRAKFSGSHAARVLRFSGRSRLFHFDFLCDCVTQFCGNRCSECRYSS
jgi:hypothetical protein